jgi:DNA-binding transcriptional LysR family regulator
MLNVQRLAVFREVAARRSFSAAAEALAYTQSAVSQSVATLEREVGVRLIERDRRELRPTEAGMALLGHADGIIARIEAAEADLAGLAGVERGRLRMAAFPTGGATLVPLAVATFRSAHPGVELSLAEGEPEVIAPRLRAGEFDVALLYEFPGQRERWATGLDRTRLLEDPMHVALPRRHRLASRPVLGLEDLRGEAWIQTSAASPCAQHIVRSCHEAGFEPAVSFQSDDYGTIQGLVAAGVGIALIPQLALTSIRDDVAIRRLDADGPARRVVAATARGGPGTPAAAAMLKVLADVARAYAPLPERAQGMTAPRPVERPSPQAPVPDAQALRP